MKSHFSLILSQLLPKSQSLTLDCDFVFLIWQLIHSVQIIHSEMTFGCQAAAQGAPASTAKVFLRLNLQSLRWIASLFLIKPSLTCSVAPSLQNANILLVCILVFLPTLENSRTPCLFVHFTKGRVSVFDVRIACIFLLYRTSRRQYIGKQHGFQEKIDTTCQLYFAPGPSMMEMQLI